MAANSNRNTNRKRINLRSGCFVHKLKNGELDASNTVFECNYVSNNKCKIQNLFCANPKSTRTSFKNLIPQTLVYYHRDCKKHAPLTNDDGHPENRLRVRVPLKLLNRYGLLDKCVIVKPKEATDKQLLSTHTQSHTDEVKSTQQMALDYKDMIKNVFINEQKQSESKTSSPKNDERDVDMLQQDLSKSAENENKELIMMSGHNENDEDFEMDTKENDNENENENENEAEDNDDSCMIERIGWFNIDTFYNEHSYRAAKLACGAAIGLIKNVINERCVNGIAIVRPPGHHCERDQVMGFCLYNNVAVAVNVIKQRKLCKKILIVDWDLHHGNGTQNMFINDKDVMYFSVHRHDNGNFYPSTGRIREDGEGYNVNVPLNKVENARYGDAAYMDIWKCILIPIALQFEPEIIVISAGFDACIEDPINGNVMAISPPCYGVLCRMLMNVCSKVAVILEGGYQLNTMAPAIAYVTWALLRGSIDNLYEYQTIENYNQSQIQLYVENTLWYKSIFFEYEFKRFVLDHITLKDGHGQIMCDAFCIESYQRRTDMDKYDNEQQSDLTKIERRRIMKKVLIQHQKYWTFLKPLCDYFRHKY